MNPETPRKMKVEEAIVKRLAAFGQREVDISRLEERVRAALNAEGGLPPESTEQDPEQQGPPSLARLTWLRPAMGLAAMLAVAVALLFAFNFNPPQASASDFDLSQLHEDIASGRLELQPVTTIEDANRLISDQIATAPALPDRLANARVQSCCLTDVQAELAAVALLQVNETPVTLVVARAENFGVHDGHRDAYMLEVNGKTLHGHMNNGTRMVMANQGDLWLCVMGEMDYPQLAEVAAGIDF